MSSAWFFRVHSWLGIVTGVCMLAIAWSGSLVVFNDEIEWLLNQAVRANPAAGAKPIDDVLAVIRERYPEHRAALHLQIGPHWAHTALVYQPEVTRFLQIDPATADIRSDVAMEGYTFNVAYFLRQLHVRLLMGFWGRVFVGVFGVTLVLSVITSLWIYREWIRSLFRIRRHHSRRIFHMDLHKAVGLWSLAFNLMFGVTGGILGLENLYNRFWAPRAESAAPREVRMAPVPRDLTPGGVMAHLVALDPQFHPTSIEVSPRGPVIVRGDHPGAFTAEGASTYAVMPATGEVTAAVDARRVAWPTYLYNLLDPLHFGYFGERWGFITGYLVELLWFVAGLAPGVLSISGGVMWLLRQRQRRSALAARSALRTDGLQAEPLLQQENVRY